MKLVGGKGICFYFYDNDDSYKVYIRLMHVKKRIKEFTVAFVSVRKTLVLLPFYWIIGRKVERSFLSKFLGGMW